MAQPWTNNPPAINRKIEEVNELLAFITDQENIVHTAKRTIEQIKSQINVITEGEEPLAWFMQNEPYDTIQASVYAKVNKNRKIITEPMKVGNLFEQLLLSKPDFKPQDASKT